MINGNPLSILHPLINVQQVCLTIELSRMILLDLHFLQMNMKNNGLHVNCQKKATTCVFVTKAGILAIVGS